MIFKTKRSLNIFLLALMNLFILMFVVPATAQVWPPAIPEGYIDRVVGDGTWDVTCGEVGPMEGDGGPALLTPLCGLRSLAIDNEGNLFIADEYRVRMIDRSTGIITTVAGNGGQSTVEDGLQATEVGFEVGCIAVDHIGNLYIGDWNEYATYKVDLGTGIISIIESQFENIIAVDNAGENLYWINGDHGSIYVEDLNSLTTNEVQVNLDEPLEDHNPNYTSIALDTDGYIYVTEGNTQRVLKINVETGNFTVIAGKYRGRRVSGFVGDEGPATEAWLYLDFEYRAGDAITVDGVGNVYFYDSGNYRIRKVDAETGIITTVAGNGNTGNTGDGGPAIEAGLDLDLDYRAHIAIDEYGNIFAPTGYEHPGVRRVYLPPPVVNQPPGSIAGTVNVNSVGLENVLVKLLDELGLPVDGFDDIYTDANGQYSFIDVPIGDYQVMIVEPLGYIVDLNPKLTTVIANETSTVNFDLTEIVLVNTARSKGYWKHQYDVYVKGRGNAQETEQNLYDYIDLVHQHYTLYYDIFTDVNTFEEWQAILSLKGNHPMADRAKQHLSALILNMVSNKIGQYTIVTDDGRDVGDVVQYVSELIINSDDTDDELAKDLAESVNNQQMIGAGIVEEGSIIFKTGEGSNDIEVTTYELFDNYPNPFNPSTKIVYQIPERGNVSLKVYDMLGKEVSTLVEEYRDEGRYEINFDAGNLASGIYIYQLRANNYIATKKMILMK